MRVTHPYLRVVAGFFAALFLLGTVELSVDGEPGAAVMALVFALALGWFAVAQPLRARRRAERERQRAVAERADAAHHAFEAGDMAGALAPPPPPPPRPPVRRGVLVAVAVAVLLFVLVLVAQFVEGSPAGDAHPAPAGQATSAPPSPAAPTRAAAPGALPSSAAAVAEPAQAAPATGGASVMPATVCMNLQAAQDLIQDAGVFYSRSEDATGRGRMQLLDRNWVVVAQEPAPGAPIGEGDAVLSVVKRGEPGDCS